MLHNLTYKGMKRETKADLQIWTAVGMLIAGVTMSFIGFFVEPAGIIHDSVLWFFAQCLLYAGSIFGVSIYVTGKVNKAITNFKQREEGDDKQQQ
ncbi:hypothetical protein BT401P3_00050 [Bacteroides phage BT401P3]|nr:hypothetical protein BT401P2_00020 [Bacteroides phage BT401P2]WAX09246.1 hypothetical protein BT401P3_00050 [Bacteroides phage BT401P3]